MKNKFKIIKSIILSLLFCFFSSVCASQESSDKILPAQSIEELQKQLEQTLKENAYARHVCCDCASRWS